MSPAMVLAQPASHIFLEAASDYIMYYFYTFTSYQSSQYQETLSIPYEVSYNINIFKSGFDPIKLGNPKPFFATTSAFPR